MKRILLGVLGVLLVACGQKSGEAAAAATKEQKDDSVRYENELFSITLPPGWSCDDGNWQGLDQIDNVVDFGNPGNFTPFYIHVVKCFFPLQFKDIEEAMDFERNASGANGAVLVKETDSVTIGGYPAGILDLVAQSDEGTVLQHQYVTYLPESHITMYFNVVCLRKDSATYMAKGDEILRTVRIKQVKNPLDDKQLLEQRVNELAKRQQQEME